MMVGEIERAVEEKKKHFREYPNKLLGYVEKSVHPCTWFEKSTGVTHNLRGPVAMVGAHLNQFSNMAGVPLMNFGKTVTAPDYGWVLAASFSNIKDVLQAFQLKYPNPRAY